MSIGLPRSWHLAGMGLSDLVSPDAGPAIFEAWLDDCTPFARREAGDLLDAMTTRGWAAASAGRSGADKLVRVEAGGTAWIVALRPGVSQPVRYVRREEAAAAPSARNGTA